MQEKLKILILEDVSFDAELIEYELRRSEMPFSSKIVEKKDDFINALSEYKPDLILADHSLPSFDGATALKITKEKSPNTLFFFVSGKIGEEFAVEMLKTGATDYVFKNNLSKLIPAINRGLKEAEEKAERRKAEESLLQAHAQLETKVKDRTKELQDANEELQKEIQRRTELEDEIRKSLEEKEVLLREIHHRVKNNLQIISSLINLQSNTIDDPAVYEDFKEIQNRVKSIALIHEKLYQSKDLSKINFAEYIPQLASDLYRSYEISPLIDLGTNVDDILLDINKALPCGLIINELITNSIKHAFPDAKNQEPHYKTSANELNKVKKGKITINFHHSGDIYKMELFDNGIGYPENLDLEKTETLGLRLVNSLKDQLAGEVEIKNENGAFFRLTFKE